MQPTESWKRDLDGGFKIFLNLYFLGVSINYWYPDKRYKLYHIIETHGFAKITEHSSGESYFHMTIGNMQNGTKLLCETTLGYKMGSLLESYTEQIHNNLKKQRSRKL